MSRQDDSEAVSNKQYGYGVAAPRNSPPKYFAWRCRNEKRACLISNSSTAFTIFLSNSVRLSEFPRQSLFFANSAHPRATCQIEADFSAAGLRQPAQTINHGTGIVCGSASAKHCALSCW